MLILVLWFLFDLFECNLVSLEAVVEMEFGFKLYIRNRNLPEPRTGGRLGQMERQTRQGFHLLRGGPGPNSLAGVWCMGPNCPYLPSLNNQSWAALAGVWLQARLFFTAEADPEEDNSWTVSGEYTPPPCQVLPLLRIGVAHLHIYPCVPLAPQDPLCAYADGRSISYARVHCFPNQSPRCSVTDLPWWAFLSCWLLGI